MTGKVLQFDEVRGYGFIQPKGGGEDVFMHANDLLDEKYLFQAGSEVEFSMEMGDKGPKASEIRLIHQPPSEGRFSRSLRPAPVSAEPGDAEAQSAEELRDDLTSALVEGADSLTGAQIKEVRECVIALARQRGWVS
nr:cold shock domain-containing protein [Streptomyces boncukensis]